MRKLNYLLIISTALTLISSSAHAYIGPGLGGGVIAATLGVIIAILAALFGILYFPIKRLIKNRKQKNKINEQK